MGRSSAAALAACLLGFAFPCTTPASELPWSDSQQLVLVTTAGWDANQGVLTAFELDGTGWKRVHGPAAVAIGRAGSAWGRGLHPHQAGLQKKEGDGRSPAGVFRIGGAFGYERALATALSYKQSTATDYCIDVSASPLYNQIVDAAVVGEAAVKESTEPMRLDLHRDGDVRYRLGFVIQHNTDARPQGGSCIFAHLWRSAGEATSGCTSMDEEVLRALLAWLRPESRPVFVLLPQAEYSRKEAEWRLPDL